MEKKEFSIDIESIVLRSLLNLVFNWAVQFALIGGWGVTLSPDVFGLIRGVVGLSSQPVTSTGSSRIMVAEVDRVIGLTEADAAAEADKRVHSILLQRISELSKELTGRPLLASVALKELVWLERQEGVQRRDEKEVQEIRDWEKVERSTYFSARHKITLEIPNETLVRWSDRQLSHYLRRLTGIVAITIALGAGWLLGLALMVHLDRVTGGYSRATIVASHLVGLSLISVLTYLWWLGFYT